MQDIGLFYVDFLWEIKKLLEHEAINTTTVWRIMCKSIAGTKRQWMGLS